MRIAVAAALLVAFTAGSALAQSPARPADKAKPAPRPAQAAPAKPSLSQLAAQGDVEAQYQLAIALRDGKTAKGGKNTKGIKKNPAEAASWLALAAANGNAPAAADLARLYEQGNGVKRDLDQAADWWFRAGQLGNLDAQSRFVALFLAGSTASLRGPTSAQWLGNLAATGRLDAILALGEAYERGEGIVPDADLARHWYEQAAFAGDAEAKFRLGRMLLREAGAWRLIYKDPEREAKNAERDKFYPDRAQAATIGGDDRVPDPVRPGMVDAETWLRDAARQGHAEAQYTLGMAFLTGFDLPFHLDEAIHWLSAAAWNGHAQALMQLGDLAAKGQGFGTKDPIRAWVNYDLAAGQGLKPAEAARDNIAKAMNPRQLGRARQIVQEVRGS